MSTQLYVEFATKTVQDIIREKQAEVYQKRIKEHKRYLNQAIFLTL